MLIFDHMGPSLIFWGAVLLIVFITSLFGFLERQSRYRTIEKMVEKGQTVPPEMLSRYAARYDRYDRHGWHYTHPAASGIFLMCIGVAIAVFLWALQGGGNVIDGDHVPNWLPVVGIFPFMVGLARLLGSAFDRRPPITGPTNPGP
jgi:ABC-type transport system involved in cytochrome c biogenesis permease subunit